MVSTASARDRYASSAVSSRTSNTSAAPYSVVPEAAVRPVAAVAAAGGSRVGGIWTERTSGRAAGSRIDHVSSRRPMRVLVTGATGFVGARAAERFVELGHEVHALVRRPGAAPAGTRELVGDLARVDGFADRLRGIDAVVHAAALVEPLPPGQSADLINRAATIELARAARAAGCRGFVFVSSVMA